MPVSRRELIRRLGVLGFAGPRSGAKHQLMTDGQRFVRLPNPHGAQDISDGLLSRILREARISREDWDEAGKR